MNALIEEVEVIEVGDMVEVTVDLPKFSLPKGAKGKVVDVRQPGVLFEVDFAEHFAIGSACFCLSVRQCRKV